MDFCDLLSQDQDDLILCIDPRFRTKSNRDLIYYRYRDHPYLLEYRDEFKNSSFRRYLEYPDEIVYESDEELKQEREIRVRREIPDEWPPVPVVCLMLYLSFISSFDVTQLLLVEYFEFKTWFIYLFVPYLIPTFMILFFLPHFWYWGNERVIFVD